MHRVLHISEANNSSGAGVYFYLKEFIKIQKKSGIDSYWITIKNDDLILKKG